MVYELIAEDLTHLGGPMGSEYTTDKSLGLFDSIEKCKEKAKKHYNRKDPITWTKNVSRTGDVLRSDDLGWVMYHIRTRKVE
jgi:hypothetical protein